MATHNISAMTILELHAGAKWRIKHTATRDPWAVFSGKQGTRPGQRLLCDMNLLAKPLPQAVCRELRKPGAVCAALHHSPPLAASELGAGQQAPGGLTCCREHGQEGQISDMQLNQEN